MIIAVAKETFPGERRVALVPSSVAPLLKGGGRVLIEQGAGVAAGFDDDAYRAAGAEIVADRRELFQSADVLLQVRGLGANQKSGAADLDLIGDTLVIVAPFDPLGNPSPVRQVAERGATLFAMELIPRITRAQGMDVLSSMATIAGYKAVLLAANMLPKMFPLMMTAAGTLTPAKVFVIGAGVAGLQAIASARRLGAVVQAYDVRPAVKEQVESLGAKFVEMPLETAGAETTGGYAKQLDEEFYRKQRELMARVVAESDVVITTAMIPGKKAPVLITGEMLASMAPGSVVVDLAAERGGNVDVTRAGETIQVGGVTVIGPLNVAATMPYHASQMYARNVAAFVQNMIKDGSLALATDDEIVRETMVTRDGDVVHAAIRERLGLAAATR